MAACILPALHADDRSDAANALLAPLRVTDGPGCAVAVVQRDKVVYSAAFGFADRESHTPIAPSTQFNVASLSKQFTAAALYFLVSDGKVRLRDSVRRFVPELPAYADLVSVADLLHHTSGLRDPNPLLEVAARLGETPDGPANLRLLQAQSALNFPPGTDYEYSNSDYFLLGLIVERVSGKSLAEFAEDRLFRPLGMKHSGFQDRAPATGNRSVGYAANGKQFRKAPPPPLTSGDGGVYTTVEDLRLWTRNLLTGRLGGPAFLRFMETSGRLPSGESVGYAGGLSVGRYRGVRVVSHDGALPGYRADLTQFPAYQLSSILLCNRGDVDAPSLNRSLASIYLGGHLKARKGRAALDYPTTEFPKLDGLWESKQGWILRAWSGVDGLTVESAEEKHKLTPLNRSQLFVDDGSFRLTLTMLSADRMTLQWDGALPIPYQRVEAIRPRGEQLASLAGSYRSSDAGARWTLIVDQGALVITNAAGWRIPLEPVGSDRFIVGPWSLHFLRRADGTRRGIELHRARLWNLWFEKE